MTRHSKRTLFSKIRSLFTSRVRSRRRRQKSLLLESLESRRTLSATTFVNDFDGLPGLEVANVYADRVEFTSAALGTKTVFPLPAWNRVEVADLDGLGGPELIFNNLHTINGVPQRASATIVTYATNRADTYDVGAPNTYQIVDLDGLGGAEIVYTNVRTVNGVPQPAKATVLNQATRRVSDYSVGSPNRLEIADLDGLGGPELIFNGLRTINGQAQKATAVIVTYATDRLDTYDVGTASTYQIADLDGLGGPEIVYSNVRTVNGVPQQASVIVLNQALRTTSSYAVGSTNSMEIVDLDGLGGPELIFSNVRTINAVPQKATTTIVTYATNRIDTYDVGTPNKYRFANLDGLGGAEIVYSNIRVINSMPQPAIATIVNQAVRHAVSYKVGSPNRLDIVDLDGLGGPELIFDNVRTVNGIGQKATATILTYATNRVDTYDIGAPNRYQLSDLDGLGGVEIVYTNIRTVNSIPQAATVTIVNQAIKKSTSYKVGNPNRVDIANLDGLGGAELIFNNVRTVNGVGQKATLTVVTYATDRVDIYDAGLPNSFQIADLDGVGGPEIIYTNVRTVNGTPQPAIATVVNHALRSQWSIPVAFAKEYWIRQLDEYGGAELIFQTSKGITIVDYLNRSVSGIQLAVDAVSFQDVDDLSGNELIVKTPTGLRTYSYAKRRFL